MTIKKVFITIFIDSELSRERVQSVLVVCLIVPDLSSKVEEAMLVVYSAGPSSPNLPRLLSTTFKLKQENKTKKRFSNGF